MLLCFGRVEKRFSTLPFRPALRALDGVSLQVSPGDVVGLVGPNGSGKTTTLRIAAGVLRPDGGTVQVLGEAPGSSRARARTGYMPELPGLPGALTPREFLSFLARVYGTGRAEGKERIRELARLLALDPFLDRAMGRLSKGMAKRVGLAAALFNRPDLLLLDEPLEGLDPLGAAEVKAHLAALARDGTGILVSSHILSDVEAACNRIVLLHRGRVLLKGDRDAILAARDRMEVRFRGGGDTALLEEVRRFIEARGGTVEFAGHPREELEAIFRRAVTASEAREKEPSP